jgi:hypothetical protein
MGTAIVGGFGHMDRESSGGSSRFAGDNIVVGR